MTNQAITLANSSEAAHTELRTAQHRITSFEAIEAEKSKTIVSLKNGLARIDPSDRASRQQVENLIANAQSDLQTANDERVALQSKLVELHRAAAGFSHLERNHAGGGAQKEMENIWAEWMEAITPHLALAERLRHAMKCVGKGSYALTEKELLSGRRQP